MAGWQIVNNQVDKLIGLVETVYIPNNRKVVKPGRKDMLKLNTMYFDFTNESYLKLCKNVWQYRMFP